MAVVDLLTRPVAAALALVALVPVVTFITTLVRQRLIFWRLKKLGKPVPPHSFLLGHLWSVKTAFGELPPEAHSQYALAKTGEEFDDRGAWYFDCWPAFSPPALVVHDPAMLEQVMSHPVVGAQKPRSLEGWIADISGGPSMFVQNGTPWAHAHDILTPCFSTANIAAEMPVVLDNLRLFKALLRGRAASGDRFELEALCKSLVIDNTGKLVMNTRLNVLTRAHPMAEAMIYQLKLKANNYKAKHLLRLLNPVNIYTKWNNNRTLDRHLRAFLATRFAELKALEPAERDAPGGFKSAMDQILKDFIKQHPAWTALDEDATLMAVRNLRTLFFVSYDSTAAAMTSAVLCLWQHPAALARLRAELDAVLGADPRAAEDRLRANPALLNALPYALAVVKETMRIYPPAGGIRMGDKSLVLRNPRTGETFPTEGLGIQALHWVSQNNPRYWARAHEFLPERWMVAPGHELYPTRGAWRAFEFGARSCIGQQLVLTEIKAFLACVVREFDFADCYDEVLPTKEGVDLSGVGGRRVYLVEAGSAHPLGGYPCRVSARSADGEGVNGKS